MTEFKRGFTGTMRLALADEAPRVGSGVRRVDVKIGNRHATITNRTTGRRARITRALFENIVRRSSERYGLL